MAKKQRHSFQEYVWRRRVKMSIGRGRNVLQEWVYYDFFFRGGGKAGWNTLGATGKYKDSCPKQNLSAF